MFLLPTDKKLSTKNLPIKHFYLLITNEIILPTKILMLVAKVVV